MNSKTNLIFLYYKEFGIFKKNRFFHNLFLSSLHSVYLLIHPVLFICLKIFSDRIKKLNKWFILKNITHLESPLTATFQKIGPKVDIPGNGIRTNSRALRVPQSRRIAVLRMRKTYQVKKVSITLSKDLTFLIRSQYLFNIEKFTWWTNRDWDCIVLNDKIVNSSIFFSLNSVHLLTKLKF